MTVPSVLPWFRTLLDPIASNLRRAQVVLKVLRVYILTLLKCRLFRRVPLLRGRRAIKEQGLAEWVRTPLLIRRISPSTQVPFMATVPLKGLLAWLLCRTTPLGLLGPKT